jgi:hypothetical protein
VSAAAAAVLLAEAEVVGVRLRLADDGKVRAAASTPPALLARRRAHKAELAELLRAQVNRPGEAGPCPACGHRAVWRAPPGPWRCCRCEPCEAAENPGAVFDHRMPEPVPGHLCRRCGQPVDGRRFDTLVFGDGSSAHEACEDRWHVADVIRRAENALSPAAPADEAELTIRGELA